MEKIKTLTRLEVPLEKIPYVDSPEVRVSAHETTELPFRYVADAKGQPIMVDVCPLEPPNNNKRLTSIQGMLEKIKKDTERGISDLL